MLQRHREAKGFTLVELMIVIVVLGILVTLAMPSYQASVRKSRRSDGVSALMELSARQERHYAQRSVYTLDVDSSAGLNFGSTTSPEGYYDLTVAACGTGIEVCYVLTAAATGDQTKDTLCTSFSLRSTGAKTSKDSASNASNCW